MALNLPPDPYKILGVTKDAKLPEIRSAHRKLVLKCHPDKVQDAALKAIKQDEFQQVQQAYELLSDDNRRVQYDEQIKLFELRRELGRGGNSTSRANPFDFEIRTAEPRSNSYATRPPPQPTKVYAQPPPRSYEDVVYEEPLRTAKKSASYESTDRRRPSTRDGARESERRRQEDAEILREKWEKESKKAAHGEKKKSRDKEKRRGTEEKHSRSQPYVEDDSDDYRPPPPREKKSSRTRERMEEEIRIRNEAAKESTRQAPLTPKWDEHKNYAAEYMQAARRKAVPADDFHPAPMRRAETFAAPERKYNIRYATPQSPHLSPSDDEAPRRSSARTTTRRGSEAPPSRRDVPKKEHKRSPSSRARETKEPYIVEPPSPTVPIIKTPKLQSYSSAPPIIPIPRDKPSRSKTQDYPRQEQGIPPLPRAKTFQSGDREPGRDRDRGSRLKKSVNYATDDSDSDSPIYASPRHSHSPPRRRDAPQPTHTKYIIDNGRSVPIPSRHRSEMRNIDNDDYRPSRDRSESPHTQSRPPLTRASGSSGSRQVPQRSHSQAYYPPDPPEPVIHTVRPKMPARESGNHSRGGSGGRGNNPYFGEVNFAPNYAERVVYSPPVGGVSSGDPYRRGSDPSHHRDAYAYPTQRGGRGEIYT